MLKVPITLVTARLFRDGGGFAQNSVQWGDFLCRTDFCTKTNASCRPCCRRDVRKTDEHRDSRAA